MAECASSPSLSRHSGKEWLHKTNEEKNSFFRRVIDESKMKIKGGKKACLSRTASQSSLNSSSSSIVEISEGEMALVAAAAQLASVRAAIETNFAKNLCFSFFF